MRRLAITLMSIAALAIPAAAVGGQHPSSTGIACHLHTQLHAAHELGNSTSAASGDTEIWILHNAKVRFVTHISNPAGETFVAGHIHQGLVTQNGPVVVPLFSGSLKGGNITQSGKVKAAAGVAADICFHPEAYYVNYHTTANPGGAIRGQLG